MSVAERPSASSSTASSCTVPVVIVGCGRMGGAFARLWSQREEVLVHDPAGASIEGTAVLAELGSLPSRAFVLLAVKPQHVRDACRAMRPHLAEGHLVMSIAAGITLASLRDDLGPAPHIVRAMPNTAVAVGSGITAAVAEAELGSARRLGLDFLFESTGRLIWLEREEHLDIVTAMSGSGPAYFFRVAEALALVGESLGLDPRRSQLLARATLSGAGALADSDQSLADLRAQVTSPGGTTAAGVAMLEAGGIDALLARTARAAYDRAVELGGGVR